MATCAHSRYDYLKNNHPEIYKEFKAGKSVGQVSQRGFSAMSLDQIHEHLNNDMKEVYGIFRYSKQIFV